MSSKPGVLVERAISPEVITWLEHHFDVEHKQADEAWPRELQLRKLKICANMAVGCNNFDVDAMRRKKVLATNAPDVLTDTTADFGFALLHR